MKLGKPGWAWEFLRCSSAYRKAAAAAKPRRRILRSRPLLTVIEAPEIADGSEWGLCFPEDPRRPYHNAAVFWRPGIDPGILPIAALSTTSPPGQDDVVDFSQLSIAVTVLKLPSGKEHVLLRDGPHAIQLYVLNGTVLQGPVQIFVQPGRLGVSAEETSTLGRFSAFRRNGQFDASMFPPLPQAERWLSALNVLSLVPPDVRPNYLGLATTLFKHENVRHWMDSNDWIRSRLRRAVVESRHFGYVRILSPDNADKGPGL